NNSESVNQIDVIDVSCEEYAQEVLGFSDSSKSGNPTPSLDPILSTSFTSLTPFEGEGTDKLPVIISKKIKDEEKAALLKVLKSHKRAIAWKISDIKGIDPSFCTHKILMEDDFKSAIQHQRTVHDGHFPRYDRGNNGGLYGKFLGLRGFFLVMPLPFRQNDKTVRRH
ncbi:hypothetical protein Tco_1373030, partial [Tanacetum coccineum]